MTRPCAICGESFVRKRVDAHTCGKLECCKEFNRILRRENIEQAKWDACMVQIRVDAALRKQNEISYSRPNERQF